MMRLKLKTLEAAETDANRLEIKINPFSIDDFTLLISDNAQGKTRLFGILKYLARMFRDKPAAVHTNFSARLTFEAHNLKTVENICYDINVIPVNEENEFHETITREGKIIYSSQKKILYNETAGAEVKNFFIPTRLPVLSSVDEPDFITIKLLRDFFRRIVLVSANKSRGVTVSPHSTVPDAGGTDISSVLHNWQKAHPEIFSDVMNEFKQSFPFIKEVFFTRKAMRGFPKVDLLTFNEDAVEKSILQTDWSDGVFRFLHLLMASKVPFNIDNETYPPSLILVDEIENGLDFNRLKYIIHYFRDHADELQVIISSHSPLVCDFVHPGDWIVVKRNGAELNFMSPKVKEKDLESHLDLFKRKHWDFYTRHISNSDIYKS